MNCYSHAGLSILCHQGIERWSRHCVLSIQLPHRSSHQEIGKIIVHSPCFDIIRSHFKNSQNMNCVFHPSIPEIFFTELSKKLPKNISIKLFVIVHVCSIIFFFQMEISLKDQVVILDEAHNMEDTSRDSAGEKIGDDALEKAVNELDEMSQ